MYNNANVPPPYHFYGSYVKPENSNNFQQQTQQNGNYYPETQTYGYGRQAYPSYASRPDPGSAFYGSNYTDPFIKTKGVSLWQKFKNFKLSWKISLISAAVLTVLALIAIPLACIPLYTVKDPNGTHEFTIRVDKALKFNEPNLNRIIRLSAAARSTSDDEILLNAKNQLTSELNSRAKDLFAADVKDISNLSLTPSNTTTEEFEVGFNVNTLPIIKSRVVAVKTAITTGIQNEKFLEGLFKSFTGLVSLSAGALSVGEPELIDGVVFPTTQFVQSTTLATTQAPTTTTTEESTSTTTTESTTVATTETSTSTSTTTTTTTTTTTEAPTTTFIEQRADVITRIDVSFVPVDLPTVVERPNTRIRPQEPSDSSDDSNDRPSSRAPVQDNDDLNRSGPPNKSNRRPPVRRPQFNNDRDRERDRQRQRGPLVDDERQLNLNRPQFSNNRQQSDDDRQSFRPQFVDNQRQPQFSPIINGQLLPSNQPIQLPMDQQQQQRGNQFNRQFAPNNQGPQRQQQLQQNGPDDGLDLLPI